MLLALALASPLAAQGSAALRGEVADRAGAPLPGALVTAVPTAGGGARRAVADPDGAYRFAGLGEGSWTVWAERVGYAPEKRTVTLGAGAEARLDFRLAPRPVSLQELRVTGRGAEQRERVRFETEAGVTSRVIEGEQLKTLPGLGEADVLRAVEVLPGVISVSDFSSAFYVRGGSADQNLILLDGFPIFNPFHLGGLFSVFNSDVIARAELLAGGFGAQYGGRVSSVLDVETKPGSPDSTRIRGEAGISLLATRLALRAALPRAAGTLLGGSGGSWFVSGRRSYFDQLLRPVTDFPYHLTDLQGGVTLRTGGGGQLRLLGYTGEDVLDLSDFTPPGESDATDILRIRWNWGNNVLGVRLDQPVGAWTSRTRLGFSSYGERLGFVDFNDTRFESRIRQWTAGTDWERGLGGALRWKLGAEADRISYRNLARAADAEFFDNGDRGTLGAAYSALTWRPSADWIVEPGLRADAWSSAATQRPVLSPRFAVKRFFGAGRDAAVKLAAGRYVQFLHSLRDENLPVSNDRWILADAYVPPVISDQVQLGVEGYRGDGWYASAEAYLRGYRGIVDLNPADDPNRADDDFLVGHGRSYGMDFLVRRQTGKLTGWATLSLLRAQRTFPEPQNAGFADLPQTVTYPPIWDRHTDVELILDYTLPWRLHSGLRWNYGSGLPYTRPVGQFFGWDYDLARGAYQPGNQFGGHTYYVLLGQRNAQRYPAYHRLDVTLRRPFQRRWGRVTPYLQVLNAYNQRNVLFRFYNYDKNPPTVSGFSMFPLLPAVGVEASF